MKVRVTILTENKKPAALLGENPEAKIKNAWDMCVALLSTLFEDDETAIVERVELID